MLNVNPDPTILESYIEELNNRITELKTNTDIIGNYSELVADTQVLTVLVMNHLFFSPIRKFINYQNTIFLSGNFFVIKLKISSVDGKEALSKSGSQHRDNLFSK